MYLIDNKYITKKKILLINSITPYENNKSKKSITKKNFVFNEVSSIYDDINYFFLLSSSFLINPNSLPVCPATEVFSLALLVRYGTTSFTGP